MAPSERAARGFDLVNAERGAMGRGCSLLVGRAVADYGAASNEAWPRRLSCLANGGGNGVGIVAIDGRSIPSRRVEALELVIGHSTIGRAIDRYAVVVEQNDEFVEPQMSGE